LEEPRSSNPHLKNLQINFFTASKPRRLEALFTHREEVHNTDKFLNQFFDFTQKIYDNLVSNLVLRFAVNH